MEFNLILLRHARPMDRAISGSDLDRALHPKGIESVASLCQRWPAVLPPPDKILCSPALRTRQTANELIKRLELNTDCMEVINALYMADVQTMESCLFSQSPGLRTLCVIGHNPGITGWFQSFDPPVDFPFLTPCGMASVRFEGEGWNQFPLASKTVTHIDIPN